MSVIRICSSTIDRVRSISSIAAAFFASSSCWPTKLVSTKPRAMITSREEAKTLPITRTWIEVRHRWLSFSSRVRVNFAGRRTRIFSPSTKPMSPSSPRGAVRGSDTSPARERRRVNSPLESRMKGRIDRPAALPLLSGPPPTGVVPAASESWFSSADISRWLPYSPVL